MMDMAKNEVGMTDMQWHDLEAAEKQLAKWARARKKAEDACRASFDKRWGAKLRRITEPLDENVYRALGERAEALGIGHLLPTSDELENES